MSQSNPDSTDQDTDDQFNTTAFKIESCGVGQETLREIKALADDAGIRTENFEFERSSDATTDIPLLRIAGLEQKDGEELAETLYKNGITELVDGQLAVTILPSTS